MVIEQPEGQSCAAIGGIMALRMKTRGAMGCVVGGRVRDLEELNNCGLPVSTPGTINRIWKTKASAPLLVGNAPSMPGQVCLCSSLYPVCFFLFDLLDISSLFAALSALSDGAKRDIHWYHPTGEEGFTGVESSRQGFLDSISTPRSSYNDLEAETSLVVFRCGLAASQQWVLERNQKSLLGTLT